MEGLRVASPNGLEAPCLRTALPPINGGQEHRTCSGEEEAQRAARSTAGLGRAKLGPGTGWPCSRRAAASACSCGQPGGRTQLRHSQWFAKQLRKGVPGRKSSACPAPRQENKPEIH